MKFNIYITESKAQREQALNKLKKSNNENAFEDLLKLVTPDTEKHLLKLADYVNEGEDIATIGEYFKRFLSSKLSNKSLDKYPTFRDFEHAVDALESAPITKKTLSEINLKPIYSDETFDVFLGDDPISCMKFGDKYSFCISRRGSGNLYFSYRSRAETVFYFVKNKTRSDASILGKFKDPKHMIVIGVYGRQSNKFNRTFADNGSQGGGTRENITKEDIISESPELKPLFDMGIFKPKPLTQEEKGEIETLNGAKRSFEVFNTLSPDLKRKYILYGNTIDNNKWDVLNKDLRNEYIGVSPADLSDHMKSTLNFAEFSRYKQVLNQRADAKITHKTYMTEDEYKYSSNDRKSKYIEITLLTPQQYDNTPDDLKPKYIEKLISIDRPLSDQQYKDATVDLKSKYIEISPYLSPQQYDNTPDDLKPKFLESLISRRIPLSNQQYSDAPDNLKLKYLEMAISNKFILSDELYKDAPYDLKLKYIKMRILKRSSLSDEEYKDATVDLKLEYIEFVNLKQIGLSDGQYKATPDDLKQKYFENIRDRTLRLSDWQYKATPDDLKPKYLEVVIRNKLPLTDQQYEGVPVDIKLRYIEALKDLSDEKYKDAPDDLKLKYIEMCILNRSSLSDGQYKATPDDLKPKYFEILIRNGLQLPKRHYEYSKDSLRSEYIKMLIRNGQQVEGQQRIDAIEFGLIKP